MKLKTLLAITGILGCVLGLAFFFIPAQVMSTFGVTANEAHQHMARNFGGAVIALGVMSLAARDAENSKARSAIILALFTYFLFSSISILLFQLQGDVNSSGWFMFGLHVILGSAFGYQLFTNRENG